jgi:hypothetical protein
MADINDNLAAKIDERRRKLDQVDQAITEMRMLQHEIAPRLSPLTEPNPAVLAVQHQQHRGRRRAVTRRRGPSRIKSGSRYVRFTPESGHSSAGH